METVIARVSPAISNSSFSLLGDFQLFAGHFPLDAHEKIVVHAFDFEPAFQRIAGLGTKLHEHFPFQHVHEHALGAGRAATLHALSKSFAPCRVRQASVC